MSIKINLILSLVMLVLGLIGYIGLKVVQRIHANDPLYQQKQQERIMEHKRKEKETEELDNVMTDSFHTYNDNE